MREGTLEVLRAHFRPEFLNNIDEIVVFNALSMAQLTHIVKIQVARLAKRLEQRGIILMLTEAAKAALARRGYDPVSGAPAQAHPPEPDPGHAGPGRAHGRVPLRRHRGGGRHGGR